MKQIIFILFLLTASLFANDIDERKTDLYFGNGVWNSYLMAEAGKDKLQKKIDFYIINGNQQLANKYSKVKLVYNWTGTSPDNSVDLTPQVYDIIETFYQLREEGQIGALTGVYKFIQMVMSRTVAVQITLIDSIVKTYVSSIKSDNLFAMLKKYNEESFNKSHRVLLMAHSQGNMFGNEIYDALGWKQKYFKMVSIATPARRVADGFTPYTTFKCDGIINNWLDSGIGIPGHLPGQMDCTPIKDFNGDNHQLVKYYLANFNSLSEIMQNVKNQLLNLDVAPSQYKIASENITTNECSLRRAVLKHFKTGAMPDIDGVYPFNKNGKVYQVADENGTQHYVIGSIEGSGIWS